MPQERRLSGWILKGLFVQEFVVQLEMLGWGEEINEFIWGASVADSLVWETR